MKLQELLEEAVDGIDMLDGGEVPEIFRPAKLSRWYTNPETIKRLRIRAAAQTALLIEMGHPTGQAQSDVASEYNVSPETVRKWIKEFARPENAQYGHAWRSLVGVYRTHKKRGWPYDASSATRALKKAAADFRARVKKKPSGEEKTGKAGKK
jgi:transposase-like protein